MLKQQEQLDEIWIWMFEQYVVRPLKTSDESKLLCRRHARRANRNSRGGCAPPLITRCTAFSICGARAVELSQDSRMYEVCKENRSTRVVIVECCLGDVQEGKSWAVSLIAACNMQQNSISSLRLVTFVAMGLLPAISALGATHADG